MAFETIPLPTHISKMSTSGTVVAVSWVPVSLHAAWLHQSSCLGLKDKVVCCGVEIKALTPSLTSLKQSKIKYILAQLVTLDKGINKTSQITFVQC